jgi:hypothetical protein
MQVKVENIAKRLKNEDLAMYKFLAENSDCDDVIHQTYGVHDVVQLVGHIRWLEKKLRLRELPNVS